MKIINQTDYRTDQIRALVMRVAQDEVDPHRRNKTEVHIVYAKSNARTLGRGCLGAGWVKLFLHKNKAIDPVELALVIAHEFAHNRGLKHSMINGSIRYDWVDGWREYYSWASDFPIEVKPVQTKQKPDLQLVRYQRVIKSEKTWQTKLKRAQNALKKLRQKKNYYEKSLAAKNKLNQE